MAKAEITVAVERAVHDVIAGVLQSILREHGIQVTYLRAEWLDVSTAETKFILREVEITSVTRPAATATVVSEK